MSAVESHFRSVSSAPVELRKKKKPAEEEFYFINSKEEYAINKGEFTAL